jgi:hypothetical protein
MMGRAGAGLFLAVLAVAALGSGYLAVSSGEQASTSTSTSQGAPTSKTSTTLSEGPLVFVSPTSEQGLQLELTLNATTVHSGGAISGQVTIENTSNQNATVSYLGPSENVSAWSGYITECPLGLFMGYAVFAGHFTAGNISSAGTPLGMVPGATGIICPPPEYLPPNNQSSSQVIFLPGTVQTEANETFNLQTVGGSLKSFSILVPNQLNVSTVFPYVRDSKYSIACGCAEPGLVGYYQDIGGGIFFPFSRGEYTVVAWDAWNQYAYATFLVRSPEASSQSSPSATTTSGAAGANTAAAATTVTVTETLTTQAPQATTTYAIPTTSCTFSPVVTTTITTITVGSTPPATTTTTTVTTTSTSYAQTVTVTSCTYSMSTVTSTVTTIIP